MRRLLLAVALGLVPTPAPAQFAYPMSLVPNVSGFTTFTSWTGTGAHYNSASQTVWTDYGSHLE